MTGKTFVTSLTKTLGKLRKNFEETVKRFWNIFRQFRKNSKNVEKFGENFNILRKW